MYTKNNLTAKQIDNFLKLYHLGIGIKILEFDKTQRYVKTKGGISLQKMMDDHTNFMANLILPKLHRIMYILQSNKRAHCDVKPANLVVRMVNKQPELYLIDNDDVVNFGEMRLVGTPGFNCLMSRLQQGYIAALDTDQHGFSSTVKAIKLHDPMESSNNNCHVM